MSTEHLAHDIFLLMLNISQLKKHERILTVFLEAMNDAQTNVHLRLSAQHEHDQPGVVEIATGQNSFGWITLEGDIDAHPNEVLALIRNAVRMLAIVLENRARERLLADDRLRLEEAVRERTSELLLANEQLMGEIAERQRAEEEQERLLAQIQEQAHRIQHVVNTVPEGVILLDAGKYTNGAAHWRIILANPVAEKDLAFLNDAKVGDALTHLGDCSLAELLTSPPRNEWYQMIVRERTFQIIARPTEASGPIRAETSRAGLTPGAWVLVIRDVTYQREFEQHVQRQERLAAVGQLAAGIAHDFNNVLATIVLYVQMTMQTQGLPARVWERMKTIDRQAKHATHLIQQILDFSRRAVLERQSLDLVPLLEKHIELLKRTLPENIEIKLTCGLDEYTVHADPTRVQQAITNLALNARDAMPEGGEFDIELERVRIKSHEKAPLPEMKTGEWIQITVSDTGTGIPPNVLPRIFEPFFTTRAPLGSGLGLSQVHGIVAQHKGHIDVETKVGHGTTFIIYLPPLVSQQADVSLARPDLDKGNRETILLVEDNAITRKALAESLTLLNYRVLEAANGHQALDMLGQRQEEIALVLSDVVMPEMGGIALLHAMRERGIEVGVVLLTGHPLEKELEDLQARGIAPGLIDWLIKPLDLNQLAQVIARALEKVPASS